MAQNPLAVFVGRWSMEGQQYEGPFGPAAKVTALESFEWLNGKLFLIHRFDGQLDDRPMACIEVIERDRGSDGYRLHSFYNDGRTVVWDARFEGDTFVINGTLAGEGKPVKVRCTSVFGDLGRARTGKWERSTDGSTWDTFWDVNSTKVA